MPEEVSAIGLFVLIATFLLDLLALPWRFADRRGYTVPFKAAKLYLSNALGFLILCICVPGAIISLMICFLRSWADNQIVFALLLLFVFGAFLGLFLSSNGSAARKSQA